MLATWKKNRRSRIKAEFSKLKNPWDRIFPKHRDAVLDYEDGVRRCGNCGWEIVGNECVHCGMEFGGPRMEFETVHDDGPEEISEGDYDLHNESGSDDSFVVGDEEMESDNINSRFLDDGSENDSDVDSTYDSRRFSNGAFTTPSQAHNFSVNNRFLDDDSENDSDVDNAFDSHRFSSGSFADPFLVRKFSVDNFSDSDRSSSGSFHGPIFSDDDSKDRYCGGKYLAVYESEDHYPNIRKYIADEAAEEDNDTTDQSTCNSMVNSDVDLEESVNSDVDSEEGINSENSVEATAGFWFGSTTRPNTSAYTSRGRFDFGAASDDDEGPVHTYNRNRRGGLISDDDDEGPVYAINPNRRGVLISDDDDSDIDSENSVESTAGFGASAGGYGLRSTTHPTSSAGGFDFGDDDDEGPACSFYRSGRRVLVSDDDDSSS